MAVDRVWFMGAGQQDLSFDTVVRESHSAHLNITHNPVETGVSISDHAYMEPLQITIEAIVSDVWIHAHDDQGNLAFDIWGTGGPEDAASGKFGAVGDDSSSRRSATAWQALNNLMVSAEPFDVQTGLKLYENMVLTGLEVDQDKITGGKLHFRATLEQVIQVSTQTVTYPPRAPKKTTHQASKTVAAGEQSTAPVTTPQQSQTVLDQMIFGAPAAPTNFVGASPNQ